MEKETTFIYTLVDPRDKNNIRYIGKTNNPNKRLLEHIKEALSDKHSKKINWIKKLLREGVAPLLEILDEVPRDEWEFWEIHYHDLLISWGFILTNLKQCGLGNSKHAPETIELLREISISRSKRGEEHHMYGKKLSQEHKDKMKEGSRLKPIKTKKIYQYTKDGELIKIHNSAKECIEELSLTRNQLQECLAGYKIISKDKRKNIYTVKGFIFKKEEDKF